MSEIHRWLVFTPTKGHYTVMQEAIPYRDVFMEYLAESTAQWILHDKD